MEKEPTNSGSDKHRHTQSPGCIRANKQEVRTGTLPVPPLTVQPVVVVGFRPDVMLAAAADGRTEDGGVGAHKIYRGAGVQLAICRGRDGKGRKIRREEGRDEHKREGKGRKMDRKKGDMKGDKDGKKEKRREGRRVGGKFKSDDVLPSLTVGFLCVGGPSVFV